MKAIKFLLVAILLTIVSTQEFHYDQQCSQSLQHSIEVSGQNHWNDAMQCILDSKKEIQNIIDLAEAIAEGNPVGIIEKATKVIKEGIAVISKCKALFCYGPTYKKCEAENPQGCEMWGAIVYPKCKEGYTNWLCCVCATQCPADFRDDGLYCAKPAAYGRGVGYPIWDQDKCDRENQDVGGCEKWGAIWYPKCKPGFHNVACCVCSPNCPEGWEDIGVSCKKPSSYGRGVGYAVTFGLKCLFSKEEHDLQEEVTDLVLKQQSTQFQDCEQKRINLQMLVSDVSYKYYETLGGQITLLPQQLTEMVYFLEEYIDNGCLQQDQQQSQIQ